MLTLIASWSGALIARADEATSGTPDCGSQVPRASCTCGQGVCPVCCETAACDPDRHAQSGYGLCVAPWAVPSGGPKYKSYYVGGSMFPWRWAHKARPEPRFPWEGTWGTDYVPAWTRVELWWTHGRLYQDGGGQYEPDRRNWPFGLKRGKDAASE
jgi:hypothetical protein